MPYNDPFSQDAEQLTFPEPEESLWHKGLDTILTPLNTIGTVLGSAGSEVRGLLAGKGFTNPFTNWTSGRDLLDSWGVFPKGEGFDFSGLAADFIDPFLLVGSFTGLTTAGKTASALSASQKQLKFLQEAAVTAKGSTFLPEIERGIASLTKNIGEQMAKGVTPLAEDISAQFASGQRGMQASFLNKSFGPTLNTEPLYNAVRPMADTIKAFLPAVPDKWKEYFSTSKLTDLGTSNKKLSDWLMAKGLDDSTQRLNTIKKLTDTAIKRLPTLDKDRDGLWKLVAESQELPDPSLLRKSTDAKIAGLEEQIHLTTDLLDRRIQNFQATKEETDIYGKLVGGTKTEVAQVRNWRVQAAKDVKKFSDELVETIVDRDTKLARITELSGLGGGIIQQLGKFYTPSMKEIGAAEKALWASLEFSSDLDNYLHRGVLTEEGYRLIKSNEAAYKNSKGSVSAMINAFKERDLKGLTLAEANETMAKLHPELKGKPFFETNPLILNEHRLFVSQVAQYQAMTISNAALHHYETFPMFEDWARDQKLDMHAGEPRALANEQWTKARDEWAKTNNMKPLAELLSNGKLTGTMADVPIAPSWIPEEYRRPWVEGKISDTNLIQTLSSRKDPVLLTKGESVLFDDLARGREGKISWGLKNDLPTVRDALDAAGIGNRFISGDIYTDLVRTNQAFTNNQKPFWRYWDTMNQLQRTYLTSLNPGYLGTNTLGNTWVNFIAGIKPSAYVGAFKALVNKYVETNPEGWMGRITKGFDLSPQELEWSRDFFQTGAGGKNFLHAAVEQEEGVARVGLTANLTDNFLTRAGYKINSFNEDLAKMAHYFSKRGDGFDLLAAGDSVKKYLFDYSDITQFEKDVMRRFVLFYTFTRKMLPLSISETFLNQRAYFASRVSQESMNSEQFVPDYVKNTGQIYIGGDQFIDLRNPLFDTNRFSPEGQDLARTGQKLLAGTPAQVRLPLEFISGKQFFSGRNLTDATPFPGTGGTFINKQGVEQTRVIHPALNELLSGTPAPQIARQVEGHFGGPGITTLPSTELRRLNATQQFIQSKLMDFPEVKATPGYYSAAAQPDPKVKAYLEQLRQVNKAKAGL